MADWGNASPTKKIRVTGGAQDDQNPRHSERYRRADARYFFDLDVKGCDRENGRFFHKENPAKSQHGRGS